MKAKALLLGSVLLFAACGDDSDGARDAERETQPPTQNVVEVGLTEYAFEMPDEVTGGTITFQAQNSGSQPHEVGFAAIKGDQGLEEVMSAVERGEPPRFTEDLAGIPVVSPGIETSMTRELDEGSYAFWCFLPTPEGEPHAAEGMVKVFTVTGISDASPPEPDLTITVTDDGFQVPEVAAGTYTIDLVNEGTKLHEFAFISFEPGKGERDLGRWFGSGYETDPPAVFPGGLQAIPAGTSVIVGITFESGRTYTLEDFGNNLRTRIVVE